MAIEAFQMGLLRGSPLYRELTICQTFEEVQMKAMAFVRLEEDKDQEQGATDLVEWRSHGAQRSTK